MRGDIASTFFQHLPLIILHAEKAAGAISESAPLSQYVATKMPKMQKMQDWMSHQDNSHQKIPSHGPESQFGGMSRDAPSRVPLFPVASSY